MKRYILFLICLIVSSYQVLAQEEIVDLSSAEDNCNVSFKIQGNSNVRKGTTHAYSVELVDPQQQDISFTTMYTLKVDGTNTETVSRESYSIYFEKEAPTVLTARIQYGECETTLSQNIAVYPYEIIYI